MTTLVWEAVPLIDLSDLSPQSLEEAHLVCMTQVSEKQQPEALLFTHRKECRHYARISCLGPHVYALPKHPVKAAVCEHLPWNLLQLPLPQPGHAAVLWTRELMSLVTAGVNALLACLDRQAPPALPSPCSSRFNAAK